MAAIVAPTAAAADVISKLPRVIVFDLDACCWEPEMYQLGSWGSVDGGGSPFT
eukprot:SAG11_NODE_22669_length_402_cov_0.851485_1_plen_53_part_00